MYDGLRSAIYKLIAANISEYDIKDMVNMIFDEYNAGDVGGRDDRWRYGVMP